MEQRLDTQMERLRTVIDDERPDIERDADRTALRATASGWLRADIPDEIPMSWERQSLHWPLAFPEVFFDDNRNGFDAVVGNPPFLGGKRISTVNGLAYREFIVETVAQNVKGNADLVVYFFLRSCSIARSIGLLATNSVSQGDTREVGLDRLVAADWVIHRAVKSEPWPNEASLEIAKIWLSAGKWTGVFVLNHHPVLGITSSLEEERRVGGAPQQLLHASGKSFIGCALNTMGFILTEEDAMDLLTQDERNADVVRPYLNGADLNDHPQQQTERWVIDFADWPLKRAEQYEAPFELIERRVKLEVLGKKGYPGWAKRWWQFWNPRPGLRAAISGMDRSIVIGRVSKTVIPVRVSSQNVVSEQLVVFAYDDDAHLGLLTSAMHWWWVVTYASTLETRIRYTPTDCFETFPQPEPRQGPRWEAIGIAGWELDKLRAVLMVRSQLGLTKTYNRVHNAGNNDLDIVRLRDLHVDLDLAVLDAYGWSDLELGHQHWETTQGVRFTVSPEAKDDAARSPTRTESRAVRGGSRCGASRQEDEEGND